MTGTQMSIKPSNREGYVEIYARKQSSDATGVVDSIKICTVIYFHCGDAGMIRIKWRREG